MPINRTLEREHEMAVQEETTYGTDPGAVGATNFFKHQSDVGAVERVIARYDRDMDRDFGQASVLSTQKGRESTKISIKGDVIPAGVTGTPTNPDMNALFRAIFGTSHKATAHTTTGAGSSGTSLVLTGGGFAAAGFQDGDMLACDTDGTGNAYEVRQIVSHVTDTITLDRAFTTNPTTGRTVKAGTTYTLLNTAAISLHLKRFLGGSTLKYKVPGVILTDMDMKADSAKKTPTFDLSFSGAGMAETTLADTRPTPTTVGLPLTPQVSQVWFGAGVSPTKLFSAGVIGLKVNNGLDLRENESRSTQPTGPKRTANNARYKVEMSLGMLLTTGTEDTSAIYAALQSFTAQDVLVQIGNLPGYMVAWRCPNWVADPKLTARDGEFGLDISGGRAYGVAGDDEVRLAFI
jgi:hypothetical protein